MWKYAGILSFYSCEELKSFDCPCKIYSASLHPDKSCFVAGGEDFRLFKFDYETGKELGKKLFDNRFVIKLVLVQVFKKMLFELLTPINFRVLQRALWSSSLCSVFTWRWALCIRIRRWNFKIVANNSG